MLHVATNMREICYCGHSGDVEDCDLVWEEASVRRLSVRSVVISTTPLPQFRCLRSSAPLRGG